MPVSTRHDAPTFELPGVRFTTLCAPSRGSTENSVWEVAVEPGVPGTPHRVTREETFVALHGRAVIEVDGQHHELAAGDALVVPAGRTLSLSNPGPQVFRAFAVLPVGGQVEIDGRPPFTPAWAA